MILVLHVHRRREPLPGPACCIPATLLPAVPRGRAAGRRRAVIRGLLSGLERKTCEPIAIAAGVHRKPIQFLVDSGRWDEEAVTPTRESKLIVAIRSSAEYSSPRRRRRLTRCGFKS